MDLTGILDSRAVRILSGAPSKKRLLQIISEHAAEVYDLNAAGVFSALQNRELLGSTGVGRGIAIPHARMAELDRVIGLFTRVVGPVEFASLDHRPVDLVFTLLAPDAEGAEHLKALALVSRTLRDESVCDKLRANDTAITLFTILSEASLRNAA